jgi:hypothetical protein
VKKARKLAIKKVTLRNLDEDVLGKVAGATALVCTATCPANCPTVITCAPKCKNTLGGQDTCPKGTC